MADGSPLGTPVSLAGGVASLPIATLAHGIHTIAAGYAGDGNFFGCTNALGSNQVIDQLPLTGLATYTRASNDWLQISVPELLASYTSDPDGDVLALVSVGSGTNGATVLLYGSSIYYLPSNTDPDRNTTDYLDYAVTDGFPGGTVTNKIRIQVNTPVPTAATLTQITLSAGTVTLTLTGSPNSTYQIQRTAGLDAGSLNPIQRTAALEPGSLSWQQVGTTTTDGTGVGRFTDTNPPPVQGYYRAVSQ
jgi:hypothetical protein